MYFLATHVAKFQGKGKEKRVPVILTLGDNWNTQVGNLEDAEAILTEEEYNGETGSHGNQFWIDDYREVVTLFDGHFTAVTIEAL